MRAVSCGLRYGRVDLAGSGDVLEISVGCNHPLGSARCARLGTLSVVRKHNYRSLRSWNCGSPALVVLGLAFLLDGLWVFVRTFRSVSACSPLVCSDRAVSEDRVFPRSVEGKSEPQRFATATTTTPRVYEADRM